MEKKQVYFIINGTETTVEVESSDIALNCAMTALMQVGANGRSIEEYQIISNDQTLYWDKPLLDQVKPDGVVFLSLKAGVGGNIQPSEQKQPEGAEEILKKHFDEDWPEDMGVHGTVEEWEAFKESQPIFINSMILAMQEFAQQSMKQERERVIQECIDLADSNGSHWIAGKMENLKK